MAYYNIDNFTGSTDTCDEPAFRIIVRHGANLADKSTFDQPKAYFGFSVLDMPNYSTFISPNSPVSNGSLIFGIQATAVYIYKWLESSKQSLSRASRSAAMSTRSTTSI